MPKRSKNIPVGCVAVLRQRHTPRKPPRRLLRVLGRCCRRSVTTLAAMQDRLDRVGDWPRIALLRLLEGAVGHLARAVVVLKYFPSHRDILLCLSRAPRSEQGWVPNDATNRDDVALPDFPSKTP